MDSYGISPPLLFAASGPWSALFLHPHPSLASGTLSILPSHAPLSCTLHQPFMIRFHWVIFLSLERVVWSALSAQPGCSVGGYLSKSPSSLPAPCRVGGRWRERAAWQKRCSGLCSSAGCSQDTLCLKGQWRVVA